MGDYPQLAVNLTNLRHNYNCLKDICRPWNVGITPVVKGFSGIPEAAKALWDCGANAIASSRMEQLQTLKERYPDMLTELLRIPGLSDCAEVVRYADISLESEPLVLERLNQEALKAGKVHQVILMKDIGDRREGFEGDALMIETAVRVEQDMPGLSLLGIGANFACYGSIMVTRDKLDWLVRIAEAIDSRIGRKLERISIGGTASFSNTARGELPGRVNDIRAGISLITEAAYTWPEDFEGRRDSFRLRAEIVECKDKPTMPSGKFGAAALNAVRKYEDLGVRRRGILALGKQDFGSPEANITPVDPRIRIWGASSDHTMIDLEDCKEDYKLGDIVEFNINYVACMYLTQSGNVKIAIEE